MTHLSEEEMIAQAYGEGDTAAAKGHLEGCAECSNAYAALESDLAEMKFAEPPERDAFYGERVWASLSGSLRAYEIAKVELATRRAVERFELCRRLRPAGGLAPSSVAGCGSSKQAQNAASN